MCQETRSEEDFTEVYYFSKIQASLAKNEVNFNIQSGDCVIPEKDGRRGAGVFYKVIVWFSNNLTL